MPRNSPKGGRPKALDSEPQPNLTDVKRLVAIKKKYELDEIDSKILRYHNKFPSITDSDLAALVGIDINAVTERKATPVYQKAFSDYNRSEREMVQDALKRAMMEMVRIVSGSADPLTKIRATEVIIKAYKEENNFTQINIANSNQQTVNRVYKTTIQDDGTLLGMVMDLELGKEDNS